MPTISMFWIAVADRLEEAEEQAGAERGPGPPLGEDQRGQRDEAAPGAHVLDEARGEAGGEIGAREAAQEAADRHRGEAQPHDRDAGGVDGGRVLAHRAQAQAEAGAEEHPPGQRHGE
jgi:hypothetical protein